MIPGAIEVLLLAGVVLWWVVRVEWSLRTIKRELGLQKELGIDKILKS